MKPQAVLSTCYVSGDFILAIEDLLTWHGHVVLHLVLVDATVLVSFVMSSGTMDLKADYALLDVIVVNIPDVINLKKKVLGVSIIWGKFDVLDFDIFIHEDGLVRVMSTILLVFM